MIKAQVLSRALPVDSGADQKGSQHPGLKLDGLKASSPLKLQLSVQELQLCDHSSETLEVLNVHIRIHTHIHIHIRIRIHI